MKKLFSVFLAALLAAAIAVSSCGCGAREKVPDSIDDNYRVFYEIFVGSFSDSDGDGCGDLGGIINRLDYLNDGDVSSGKSLGVQGLWLSPIFSSPSYHRYDVTDYYTIDKKIGDEQTLRDLIGLCRERNVKVILDLPINHTSDSNVWFSRFVNAHKSGDTSDPYYDFYTHCTLETRKGGRAYNAIPGCPGEYYECNFSPDMPELNFDCDAVRQAVLDVAKHYLELGVDGFRFDAVKYIYFGDYVNSVDFWQWYAGELRGINPDVYLVGECWSNDAETLRFVTALNCFNFQTAQSEGFVANAAKGVDISVFTGYIERYQDEVALNNPDGMMIPFISNHDMDRCSGYLTLATKRMQMAANLYILCAGSPFIYYGEEIGLKGSRGGSSTDANRRLAMLWGDGDTVKDPIGTTYDSAKQTNGTVAEQLKNDGSLYNYYCELIAVRNRHPEIARGDYAALDYDDSRFGGFAVTWQGSTIGVFHNTSDSETTVELSQAAGAPEFTQLCECIGQGEASLDGGTLTIGPQTSVILK